VGADARRPPRPGPLSLPPSHPRPPPSRTGRHRRGDAGPRHPPRSRRIENQDLTPSESPRGSSPRGSGLPSTLYGGQTRERSASSTAPFTSGTL
jgi:hypothetical protein